MGINNTAMPLLDLVSKMKQEEKQHNEIMDVYGKNIVHVAFVYKVATSWCKPRKYVMTKHRKWKRWVTVSFNEYTGTFRIILDMAASDSIKTTIADFLEPFMDYHTTHFIYTESEKVEYMHKFPNGLKLEITANAKHSIYCGQVPTGKMIPEMKFECKEVVV